MIFGDSSLILKHISSGAKIHFNAFDALVGWKHEALPPVEVPAAAQWKFRRCRSVFFLLPHLTYSFSGAKTASVMASKSTQVKFSVRPVVSGYRVEYYCKYGECSCPLLN